MKVPGEEYMRSHVMSDPNKKTRQKKIEDKVNSLVETKEDDALYRNQRERRDIQISEILDLYTKSFRKKVDSIVAFRWLLLASSLLIVFAFAYCFVRYSIKIMSMDSQIGMAQFGSFASAAVTIITAIFGILTIIVRYFFPENDEQNLANMVKAIQENDYRTTAPDCIPTDNQSIGDQNKGQDC